MPESAAAAVAGDDKGEDDEPDPVVVKQVAQAVVHNRIPPCRLAGTEKRPFLLSEYVERGKTFRKKSERDEKAGARSQRSAPPGGVGRSVGDPFDVRADLGGTVGGVEKTGDLGFVPSLDLAVGHFARVALRADGDGNDLCFHG